MLHYNIMSYNTGDFIITNTSLKLSIFFIIINPSFIEFDLKIIKSH